MDGAHRTHDTLLTRGQAAALLGLSPERVRQLVAAGTLPSQRTPLGRLFRLDDVETYAATRHTLQDRDNQQ